MSEASNDQAQGGGVRTRMPRWAWVLLVVSLALNALVAGVIVTSVWRMHRGPIGWSSPMLPNALGRFAGKLDPERRAALRDKIESARERMRPARQARRAARREASEIFRADVFEKDAFEAAMQRVRAADASLQDEYGKMLPELASEMSVEERRAFLRSWRQYGRHGRRGRWRDRDE